jgi:phosphoserine phosphatase
MNKKNIGIVILVIVVGVLSYWAGTSKAPVDTRGDNTFSQNGNRRGMANGRTGDSFVNGEVLSHDDTSVTIKLKESGSKIVFVSASSTRVTKTIEGTLTDLVVGSKVMVSGNTNTDGSITANSIQLRKDN